MQQFITYSEQETKKLATDLAKKFKSGVVSLAGELGAGKTIFVQGFAQGLGIKEGIISPTFVLVRQHKIPNSQKMLFHVDLYRLENNADIESLGLKDLWSDKQNIVLIEWANKIERFLPKETLKINIMKQKDNIRSITISQLPT